MLGTFLYYGRVVDSTMVVALGTLSKEQTKGTEKTAQAVVRLLNYAARHPDVTVRYTASNMTLHIDSDASYLSLPKARSRGGGYYYLSAASQNPGKPPTIALPINGAIYVHYNKIRHVIASTVEAEVRALFGRWPPQHPT
jgi:hypothetical protein